MAKGTQKVDEIVLDVTTKENGEHNVVDELVLELTNSIEERLKATSQTQTSPQGFTISRVPTALRRGKEVYYEPTTVSIGPYHRGNPKFEAVEEHKWEYLRDFHNRNPGIGINTYLTELRKLESNARRCYFENIKLSSKEFVEMMLLDGCFILELFLEQHDHGHDFSRTSTFSYFIHQVLIDLFLLENQIPFFILQCLFDLCTDKKNYPSLPSLASKCFSQFFVIRGTDYTDEWSVSTNRNVPVYDHLLQLYHCTVYRPKGPKPKALIALVKVVPKWLKHLKPLSPCILCLSKWLNPFNLICCLRLKQVEKQKRRITVPCATKLVEAGITFEKKKDSKSFLDVTFKDGIIEVPYFFIDDLSRSLMMNLIAFEKCKLPFNERVVSCYASFMDDIVDTPNDVEILQQNNILESYINSDKETAIFFNRLSDQAVTTDASYLLPVIKEINEYCKGRRHQWRAKLMRDHLSNPWTILSLVAAIILLILTFLQTFFAMYSYFKHAN